MNRLLTMLAALMAASAMLTGCLMDDRESTDDDADARRLSVDVPEGATEIRVHVDARAQGGEPDVTVLIEDEAGNNLATDTFSVAGTSTRTVATNVNGQDRLIVTVRVVDGDATLDVRVSATVPGQPEVIVIRETIVIGVAPTPPATGTTPPASPTTPTPTTTVTPTPPPTSTTPTNTTNSTNTTG